MRLGGALRHLDENPPEILTIKASPIRSVTNPQFDPFVPDLMQEAVRGASIEHTQLDPTREP